MRNPTLHVAISYASDDAWIAKDLHDLVQPYGYSLYCYDRMPDESRGILRDQLREIYLASWVNVLLWSWAYSQCPQQSFTAMERRFLVHRHLNKGEAESLLVVRLDDTAIPADLELGLVHDLRRIGILELEHIVVDRIRAQGRRLSPHGYVFHPPPTDKYRSLIQPTQFRIDPRFERDRLRRWEKLADILVIFPNEAGTEHVYLIPSGLCTAPLRHTVRLRSRPEFLQAKRKASLEFARRVGTRVLDGYWFLFRTPQNPELEWVTVYCAEYDHYLNENMERFMK